MSEALEKVVVEHGTESVTAIALAYLIAKTPFVFPIIGGRKIEHLHDNIQALKIKLTQEQVQYLESIVPFDVGFPWNIVSSLSLDKIWSGGWATFFYWVPAYLLIGSRRA